MMRCLQLVAGSGSGQSSDPAAGAPTPGGQEAVPGPVTRLFVIANRGISNLIQDLILVSMIYNISMITSNFSTQSFLLFFFLFSNFMQPIIY